MEMDLGRLLNRRLLFGDFLEKNQNLPMPFLDLTVVFDPSLNTLCQDFVEQSDGKGLTINPVYEIGVVVGRHNRSTARTSECDFINIVRMDGVNTIETQAVSEVLACIEYLCPVFRYYCPAAPVQPRSNSIRIKINHYFHLPRCEIPFSGSGLFYDIIFGLSTPRLSSG